MKSVYHDNIIFQEQHIKHMTKRLLNPSVAKARQTEPKSELSNQSEWEERKMLIIKINSHTEFLFQKIDFDYSELFLQLGVFLSDGTSLPMKRTFLEKNYQKILIHFFQHLFDFELQILKFKQKHETILSFAEWIEDEVSFQYPDKIQLLHKRNKQSKKIQNIKPQHPQQQNQATNNQSETQLFLKRSLDKRFQQQCSIKQIEIISSPKKKKVFQDQDFELQFVDFTSKYEESTNHSTFNTTPKQNFQKAQEKNMVFKQNTLRSYPNETLGAVKNCQKSKQKLGREIQIKSGQYQPKTNKKQAYRLKPGFKQKRGDTKIYQKKITIKPHNKKINKNTDLPQQKSRFQPQEDLIQLQNQNSQAFQKPSTPNQQKCEDFLDDLQISGLDLYDKDPQFKSEVSNLSKVGSIGSQDEQFIFQQLSQKQNEQILPQLRLLQIQPKFNQVDYDDLSLQNDNLIVQQVQKNTKIDSMKLKRRHFAEQMSKKQAYSMRARLSGIFRYSQKRFYIFPDMAITPNENKHDQNEKQARNRTKSGEDACRK